MITRAFNADPFLANMIPLLQLNEIPQFALINKSTARIVHELNVSEKFRIHSGVILALIESLQRDAKAILDNPNYKKENASLSKALDNIMAGKINYATVKAFREERLVYQTQPAEEAVRAASEFTASGLKALTKSGFKNEMNAYLLLFILLVYALILVASGIDYGVRSCVNHCRARKQQDKLVNRLAFFKDTIDSNERKQQVDEKNSVSPSLKKGVTTQNSCP
ncbi:MAG: hypothetical protein ACYCQI_04445 [Gammaproteobacteria bacterium]